LCYEGALNKIVKKILVCANFRANPNNPSCAGRGSEKILAELTQKLKQKNITIEVETSPCMGFCEIGPNIHLIPSGPFFHAVSTKNLNDIIKKTKAFVKK